MSVRTHVSRSQDHISREMLFTIADVLPPRISRRADQRLYRPQQIQLVMGWDPAGRVWLPTVLTLHGPTVKADGSDGRHEVAESFIHRGRVVNGTPAWLRDWVDSQVALHAADSRKQADQPIDPTTGRVRLPLPPAPRMDLNGSGAPVTPSRSKIVKSHDTVEENPEINRTLR